MTLLVRNEEDILAENIRFHHAMGVDNFIIMDNLSTDSTPQIIEQLSEEFEIDSLRQEEDNYNQWRWVTEMARRAASKHNADWVINNDADEFWFPKVGNLKTLCSSLPLEVGVLAVQRHNAVVTCDEEKVSADATSHPCQSVVFEYQSLNQLGKPLPGKVLHRASEEVTVAQGNHNVTDISGDRAKAGDRLIILHFPYRSLQKYESKIRLGGAAYNRNNELAPGIGKTWREHYTSLNSENGDSDITKFWSDLAHTPEEITIGLSLGRMIQDTRLKNLLSSHVSPLKIACDEFIVKTEELVAKFITSQASLIDRVPRHMRQEQPMYYNLRFSINGANAHLEKFRELVTKPAELSQKLSIMRDAISLFPRNANIAEFFVRLLEDKSSEAIERLRAACAGKRVVLHLSCASRLEDSRETVRSFLPLSDSYCHIILMGDESLRAGKEAPLTFDYDGEILRVPEPDNYESLHLKLFYAYMILDLVAKPELVVKIDDNLLLEDVQLFATSIDKVSEACAACAGRIVGAAHHQSQWHGWHIGKCSDPLIEARGYQYPLPRKYTSGGHGYVLGVDGLSACTYMYLSMKEFMNMRSVGLEDAYVGHALYACGLDIMQLSNPDKLLALPGLITKEYQKEENRLVGE